MYEIVINGVSYQFCFGMGFLREINKQVSVEVDGLKSVEKNIGFRYAVAGLFDGDPEALVNVLEVANKGQNPRATRALLDSYIDDPSVDIDRLFADVLDFFGRSNATRKTVAELREELERQKKKK